MKKLVGIVPAAIVAGLAIGFLCAASTHAEKDTSLGQLFGPTDTQSPIDETIYDPAPNVDIETTWLTDDDKPEKADEPVMIGSAYNRPLV